jgi:hypothetical protein
MVSALALLQTGPSALLILGLTPGLLAPHFSVEYRTHFTNFHQIVVGGFGQTELLCIIMTVISVAFFSPQGCDVFTNVVPGTNLTISTIIMFGSFLTGLYFNVENFYVGFSQSKDKTYAVCCMLPYIQFLLMMCTMIKSRFFETHALYFIVMNGLYLVYANAVLNLSTTASKQYDWVYFEPILFWLLNFVDCYGVVN